MIEFEAKNGVVIGEIACGHEGYIERLKQLIDVVSESGAQIVKFQIYRIEESQTERYTRNHHPKLLHILIRKYYL